MAYAYIEQPWSGRRLTGLFGAIAVNVLFVAAIATGLNFDVIKNESPPTIDLVPVDPVIPPEPDPVPKPEVVEPKPYVLYVPPIVDDFPPEPVEPPVPTAMNDPAPPQPNPTPVTTELQADPRYPLARPIYPPQSIRRDEQGVVTLLIYVLPDGRIGDVRVKRSSGYPRLDEAAITAARRDWRFRPATHGGAPVAAWGQYAVTFQLTGQD